MNWRAMMGGGSIPEPYPHNSHNPQNPKARGNSGDNGNIGDGVSESIRTPIYQEQAVPTARDLLADACRTEGADLEAAARYFQDDAEDLAAMTLETRRRVIQDALAGGTIPRASPPAPDQNPVKKPQAHPDPLEALPLLPEERQFIRARTQGRPDRR